MWSKLITLLLLLLCSTGKTSVLTKRSVHLNIPKSSSSSSSVSTAVRSLGHKIDKQNEILEKLANATAALAAAQSRADTHNGILVKNCALTDDYGYLRIQLEKTGKPFDVFCEQALDEGGWTLVLQRFNGTTRTAKELRHGYNSIEAGEYFLGVDKLYALTHSRLHELLLVVEYHNMTSYVARAPRFVLTNPFAYELWVSEHDSQRYNWFQWQRELAEVGSKNSWDQYEQCHPNEQICGLERLIVFLLKWKFAPPTYQPLALPIRLFKLLLRPVNAYWSAPMK